MADVDGSDHGTAPHSLFSMIASDNAEVIPPVPPKGPETMWSVAANAEDAEDAQDEDVTVPVGEHRNGTHTAGPWSGAAAGEQAPEDLGPPPPFTGWERGGATQDTASGPFRTGSADPFSSVFSAEPVDHVGDVVDEAELLDEPWPVAAATPDSTPFSNGSHLQAEPPRRQPGPVGGTPEPPSNAAPDPWIITDRSWDDPRSDQEPWAQDPDDTRPRDSFDSYDSNGPGTAAPRRRERMKGADLDDPRDFETAILRLHPQDRERAHVPLSVCGALLDEDEVVLGVVTGQMLGRPAAVVVTEERVLVVNDRRWQPVVDIFPIDGDLVVRGRHDRQVAALSFADPSRVSMVDGIGEVAIAVELAEHIRDAGPRGGG